MLRIVCVIALWGGMALVAGAEEQWSEFRGPNGTGQIAAENLPIEWSEEKNIAWKTPIHGRGWSSPVIWDQQVWVATATEDGTKLSAVCVDRDSGNIVHDLLLFEVAEPRFRHPTNSYASCTPVIEEGRVYVHFGSYGTACVDTATGEKLWERRDFVSDDFRGPGSSPILYEDLLIVNFDGVDHQFVVAMNKQTGQTVWKQDRTIDYGTTNPDLKKAYGTPTIVEVGGVPQLVSPAAVETITYHAKTGEELWRVRHGGMNAAARPLYGHGLVYISAGKGKTNFVAVKPDGRGDITDSHIVWSDSKGIPSRPSQILYKDWLFMITDDGVASCRDAKTGEVLGRARFSGNYWSSPVAADGKIYFFDKEGEATVITASPELKVLGENKLDAGCNATPAIADDALFVRTFTHLYRIERR